MYCDDWGCFFFLRLFMQVVITLSSVVSSLKMDATKILEEMDQFKELWNQVTLKLDVVHWSVKQRISLHRQITK